MAGSLNQSGGRRRRRHDRKPPMSDINITPFVDVMLVLLIVFMVTAPLLTVGVPVDLPKSNAKTLTAPEEPLVITIKLDGSLFVQESEIEFANLIPRLQAITQNNADIRIYVRGDQALAYGEIMRVMGEVVNAGFKKVALITQQPK